MRINSVLALILSIVLFSVSAWSYAETPQSCQAFSSYDKIPLSSANVPDGQMQYAVVGQGKPILLFMGTGGMFADWPISFVKTLCKQHSVILFNYPGIGAKRSGSTLTNANFGFDSIASDVDYLLKDFQQKFKNKQKPDVAGWSLGTMFALKYAVNYPNDVDKVVLFASKPGGGAAGNQANCVYWRYKEIAKYSSEGIRPWRQAILQGQIFKLMFPLNEMSSDCNLSKNWDCSSKNNCKTALHDSAHSRRVYGKLPQKILGQQRAIVADWNDYACLKNKRPCSNPNGAICYLKPTLKDTGMQGQIVCDTIKAPILVVSGANDMYIRPAYGSLLVDGLNKAQGNATWLLKNNAGHGALIQYPQWAANVALNYFEQ